MVALCVVLAGCQFLAPAPAGGGSDGDPPPPRNVTVVGVEDGDTIAVENATGGVVYVRLVGVDTPEVRGRNYPEEYDGVPDTAAGRDWLYGWGVYVTNETREWLVGEEVRLVFDPSLPHRDYYDRLVAYVYLDGTLVNRALVQRGWARVYPVEFEHRGSFVEAQRAARSAGRGLWNYSATADPPGEHGEGEGGAG